MGKEEYAIENRQSGTHRSTKQKAEILRCLRSLEGEHFTVEELLAAVNKKDVAVSRATVYRYLTELEATDRVRRFHAQENGSALFEYLSEGHEDVGYHLFCGTCSTMFHFKNETLRKALKRFEQEASFSVDEKRIVFSGTCPDCEKRTTSD